MQPSIIITLTSLVFAGIGTYVYREYTKYNLDNAAKALPLAAQIPFFLEDYDVLDSETRVRVKRVDVYDDFALMLTINQPKKGRVWDFNIVNKKVATDPTKCIRLHLAFHCKNEAEFILVWTPKNPFKEDPFEQKSSVNDLFEGAFGDAFWIETNDAERAVGFLDNVTQERLLKIYEQNKGAWRIQKNTVTYKEPIEIDSAEKRLLVYGIMDLGFELAKRVDVM